ncbi:CvfB family protein [Agarilytica rhodophyticola]|uniref:CvfB family protein n=1 Tax=Agarilytica rhodophyticola TaxID=1737490 RepID=UPI000B343D58|nr:S1-like domain-containing RNA-binding protein [Agarilytica rhodophyticola]
MIEVGETHSLRVIKAVDFGFFLDAKELSEVLLPRRLAPKELSVGDTIEVFLYLDSEDRPIATTKRPKVEVGEFAYLKVIDTTKIGAFLDWGLDKDLLVPFSEQHRPMKIGHSYLVYVYLDKVDRRITASSKIDKFLDDDAPHNFSSGQAVNLIVANTTDLGCKAIINHSYWGMLHKSDIEGRISFGQSLAGYIKHVRPDKKIDLSLKSANDIRDKNSETVLSYLKNHNGFSSIHDKSHPQEIQNAFGMSKSAFKKAVGNLYKKRLIRIEVNGIFLVD